MYKSKIPKIIHYCWFGGKPIPEHNKKFIESWKKFCPDYEIIEWNESNYDVTKNRYMREAYENKQYAFVPDYARLDIIYEHGGIYLDTDVELVKSLDDLLNLTGFMGFDHVGLCAPGLGFGAIPKLLIIKELRDDYENINFIKKDGNFNRTTSPEIQTKFFLKKGLCRNNLLQEIDGLTIFPMEYFCPKDSISGEIHLTKNTYSIHHFDGYWADSGIVLLRKDKLDRLGLVLNAEEEIVCLNISNHLPLNKRELYVAANLIEKIFYAGKNYYKNIDFYKVMQNLLFNISECGIRNKATSLKLYFTTFRKWRIFKTPRANLRYIYHCFRNLLHV